MKKLLQLHFAFNGPFGQEMADGLKDLAESINNEPGFIWKIWTENSQEKEGGGIYLFESEETALAYLEMHAARLKNLGVKEVFGKIFDVNEPLTKINKGAIS
ncbi:monooxygenase [Photobacterium sagamiensis]|uniref:monooxygenase n=1 Tax=Photobacterium sagamiensis TaxID=2910241 RepID=UPI003D10A7FD